MVELGGLGACPLKNILQCRNISTYYTTLKIRYSSCVNGKVIVGSDNHIIIIYSHNQ